MQCRRFEVWREQLGTQWVERFVSRDRDTEFTKKQRSMGMSLVPAREQVDTNNGGCTALPSSRNKGYVSGFSSCVD